MAIWGYTELLCRMILEEAGKEAEEILAAARADAEKLLADARTRSAAEFERRRLSEKASAFQESKRMVDALELDVKREIMVFQEQVIREAFQALESALDEWRHDPRYHAFLLSAIEEGAARLPGTEFIVELNGEDLRQAAESIEDLARGHGWSLTLRSSEAVRGGTRIATADGRVQFDNTLSSRIRRAEDQVRREIRRRLFGGSPNTHP